MAALLSVQNVSKTFQRKFKALKDVSLEVGHGEFVALLGPSGCGKTTLLATLAGFLQPDIGSVFIEGQNVTHLPPHKRTLNTVFQSYALFPHMTVLDNVAYGPLRSGARKTEARARAHESLEMVGLDHLADRYPAQMSGGQRQRVALARAIVNRPKLLLLDEPLSALDLKLRKRMQLELKALQEKLAISFVFVTHDQEEAMAMADRIVVMNQGVIEQIGTGDEIYKKPSTRFVADFIGDANLLECERDGHLWRLQCCGLPAGKLNHQAQPDGATATNSVVAMVRPEDISLSRTRLSEQHEALTATVVDLISIGSYTTVYLNLNDTRIEARRLGANDLALKRGDTVYLGLPMQYIHLVGA
ncbi:ABC transporter ATP-binding protein [Allopusillimonas ginsengisoli]|uniref:ABC transporter ATP-binding protein n=1 Tax=Allopusillimonas ginsengisoli TaxID=453575 RepID=UPI001020573F|nr:ABC transporter ATP-binding protein [Allopusillimonas ginsengisoli]TEA76840.1 ABC transporter ATP-binding protein [Allopusillimonas ginsengisoli]